MKGKKVFLEAVTLPYDCSRSITEVFTNTTIIQIDNIHSGAREILSGRLPQSIFFKFLHEFSHYWCFSSLIGLGLHVQFIEAYRAGSCEGDISRLPSHFLMNEALVRCLQPLSEGIAQFVEFDFWPLAGEHPIFPIAWAVRCFIDQDCADNNLASAAQSILRTARSENTAHMRKIELLLHPLRGDPSGYLVGYLALKRIWYKLACRDQRFQSGNFFLSFVKGYFYEDLDLVSILLSQNNTLEDAFETVSSYIRGRFDKLPLCDIDLEIERQERVRCALDIAMRSDGHQSLAYKIEGLTLSESQCREDFLKIYQTIAARSPDSASYDLYTLFARQITPIISIGFEKVVFTRSGVALSMPNGNSIKLPFNAAVSMVIGRLKLLMCNLSGSLEFWISPRWGSAAVTISVMGFPIFIRVFGKKDKKYLENYMKNSPSNRQLREQMAHSSEQVVRGAASNAIGDDVIANLSRKAERFHLEIYEPLALAFIPSESRSEVSARMAKDGFIGLIGKLADVEELSRISLMIASGNENNIEESTIYDMLPELFDVEISEKCENNTRISKNITTFLF